jgi:hypothetical protein
LAAISAGVVVLFLKVVAVKKEKQLQRKVLGGTFFRDLTFKRFQGNQPQLHNNNVCMSKGREAIDTMSAEYTIITPIRESSSNIYELLAPK